MARICVGNVFPFPVYPPALRLKKIVHTLKMEKLSMSVPFALPDFGDKEIREVIDITKSAWLRTASRCAQFEQKFAKFIGSNYALGVNSGTATLHFGSEGSGIGENDHVLTRVCRSTGTDQIT